MPTLKAAQLQVVNDSAVVSSPDLTLRQVATFTEPRTGGFVQLPDLLLLLFYLSTWFVFDCFRNYLICPIIEIKKISGFVF